MFGWFNAAALCASRRKRAWKLGSFARSGRRILMATRRPSRRSRPSCTSAIPPRPITPPTWYRSPSILPGSSVSTCSPSVRLPRSQRPLIVSGVGELPDCAALSPSLQYGFDHVLGDRCPESVAADFLGAGFLDDDGHRHLRRRSGSEGDEPGDGGAIVAGLGGPCLSGHSNVGDLRIGASAVVDDVHHHLGQRQCFAWAQGVGENLRL